MKKRRNFLLFNREYKKMKKISPNKGEVAKNAARILSKVVGKGLGTGLKIGGVGALAFGAAGCESTPAVPTQIINGVIVDSYQGKSVWASGGTGTYYVVEQTNPPTKEQKLLYISDENLKKYPEVGVGTYITFSWDQYSQRFGASHSLNIISIRQENSR